MASKRIPRIAFVSAMSGGGKTTASCAIMRAFKNRGLTVAPFKCGPDYIDPMHHAAAAGREGVNLDAFFSDTHELRQVFCENAADADIAVIEGVMGYYDGIGFESAAASTYDIVRALDAPAVLVLRARGMAYSMVPVIKGIVDFRSDSDIKAVILSEVTEMTYRLMKPVIERECGIRAAGYIPRLDDTTASRHLGLTMPWENDAAGTQKNAAVVAETVDIDLMLKIASDTAPLPYDAEPHDERRPCASIAVARDKAFCFYYKDNIDILKRMGAEIVYFSPLKDRSVPADVSGLILGGGYPELFAGELSRNTEMLASVRDAIERGMPCIAECGGFMYLHDRLEGDDGALYDMAGVIHSDAIRRERLVRFGYAELSAVEDGEYLKRGETIKAHEFHYWDSGDNGRGCVAKKPSGTRSWECVHTRGTLFAGFPHLYLRSCPEFARRFVSECGRYGA